jgi:hypothetical protein
LWVVNDCGEGSFVFIPYNSPGDFLQFAIADNWMPWYSTFKLNFGSRCMPRATGTGNLLEQGIHAPLKQPQKISANTG